MNKYFPAPSTMRERTNSSTVYRYIKNILVQKPWFSARDSVKYVNSQLTIYSIHPYDMNVVMQTRKKPNTFLHIVYSCNDGMPMTIVLNQKDILYKFLSRS